MGDVVDWTKGAVSGATDMIFGGKSKGSPAAYGAMTPEEISRLKDVENQIQNIYGQTGTQYQGQNAQASDLTSLFSSRLKDFITSGGQMSPEDIQKASDFVDQTFTAPTQKLVDQANEKFSAEQEARAAAMGRSPNTDLQLNQAINANATQNVAQIGAERGARIQSATNDIYNRTLGSLNAGLSGSGFLNNLAQQAFQNRMGLLNARTGLSQFYQQERQRLNQPDEHTPGLIGYAGQVFDVAGKGAKAYGALNGLSTPA